MKVTVAVLDKQRNNVVERVLDCSQCSVMCGLRISG